MTSFFEEKIKKHSKTYPELLESTWLSSKIQNSDLHHLAIGKCEENSVASAVLSKNYKSLNTTLTAREICNNINICPCCKDGALAENGFLGDMIKSQIELLETSDTKIMLELYWPGRNRTIIDSIHYKFWVNKLKPILTSKSFTKNILYCATFGALHRAWTDRSSIYNNMLERIETGFVHKSMKGSVWFYTDSEKRSNEYEVVLEENIKDNLTYYKESMSNLSELCDNAMNHGGWEDINYWWEIAKRI